MKLVWYCHNEKCVLAFCVFRKYGSKKACYATVRVNTSNADLPYFVILVVQHPYRWVVAG